MKPRRFGAAGLVLFGLCLVTTAGVLAAGGSSGPAQVKYLTIDQNKTWAAVFSDITKNYAATAAGKGSTFTPDSVDQTALNQQVQLQAGSGALPFLYVTPATNVLKQLQQKGEALNVETEFKKLGVWNDVSPAAMSIIQQTDGAPIALPLELNIEGFWFNKALFAKEGLTPPTTWPELVADAAKFKAAGIQAFAASGIQGWPITRLISDYLFSELGPNAMTNVINGKTKLTDPAYVNAATQVANLGSAGYFGPGVASLDYSPAEAVFLNGQAAMFYMGSWAVSDFDNKSLDKIGIGDIGFFPFPHVPGGKGPNPLVPANAGQTTSVNAKLLTPATEGWLKYVAQNYGSIALGSVGAGTITGFKAAKTPASLSAPDKLVLSTLKTLKNPVLWFEALMSAQATTVAQHDAAPLVTGQMTPTQFMSAVQQAVAKGGNA
jgi:raffinose/stachyose/melibiose transport system substrate-binding protein